MMSNGSPPPLNGLHNRCAHGAHLRQGTRIGERLIAHGVLSAEQVRLILKTQAGSHHPFGLIAEEMFGVDRRELWRAWAQQVEPFLQRIEIGELAVSDQALSHLPATKARQWSVLPLGVEDDGLLLCATSVEALPNAMAMMQVHGDRPPRFVLAPHEALGPWIEAAYKRSANTHAA